MHGGAPHGWNHACYLDRAAAAAVDHDAAGARPRSSFNPRYISSAIRDDEDMTLFAVYLRQFVVGQLRDAALCHADLIVFDLRL
jgi:hypothetical protein